MVGTAAVHAEALSAPGRTFDTIVVGSSTAGSALVISELERLGVACRGYSAWAEGLNVNDMAAFLEGTVLSRQKPERLIIGVTMREFIPRHPSGQGLVDAPPRRGLSAWAHDNVATLRARAMLQDPVRLGRALQQGAAAEPIAADGNQVILRDRVLAMESAAHRQQEVEAMEKFRPDPAPYRELEGLLGRLGAAGHTAVVVNLPVTDLFVDLAPNGRADYTDYLTRLEAATSAANTELIDLAATPLDRDSEYADVNHLNLRGSMKVTAALVEQLTLTGPTCNQDQRVDGQRV
jgi:hypothetical protein